MDSLLKIKQKSLLWFLVAYEVVNEDGGPLAPPNPNGAVPAYERVNFRAWPVLYIPKKHIEHWMNLDTLAIELEDTGRTTGKRMEMTIEYDVAQYDSVMLECRLRKNGTA